ncbi:MAG: hypothetical protein K2X77_03665 [Candidatus Obscuribacterales bacterium]|nr:hypothetical protein [Candidatus Obscuribacterales bacterium]
MFRIRGYLQLLLSAQLLVGVWGYTASVTQAFAEGSSGSNSTPTLSNTSNLTGTTSSLIGELDLSSTAATISGALLPGAAQVTSGGATNTFGATDMLTPAQYLAAIQSLNGGQTLTIGANGAAVGGVVNLTSTGSLGNILVPTGVSGLLDFGAMQNINLTGNLTNGGNLYLVSSNQSVTSGVLSAFNITNNSLISSIVPQSLGLSNLVSNFSFTLNAINNIVNTGTISSAGSLNMVAGNQIINSSLNNSVLANISAVRDVNMIAANITNSGQIASALANINVMTNNLMNSGLLSSCTGDISISNLVNNVLDVNNVGGIIRAQDSLDFLNSSRSTASKILIEGGLLDAERISFTDRRGLVSVDVSDISSNVSFTARNVMLNVAEGTDGLNLSGLNRSRSVELTYNGVGDVTTTGFRTRGNDVSIVTSGNINVTGNIVTTPSSNGDGGSVYMEAGGNLTLKTLTTNARGNGDGGSIGLVTGGNLTTGTLNARGAGNGSGGDIAIVSGGNMKTGGVNVSGAGDGAGGDIFGAAGGNMRLGALTTAGSGGDGAGDLFLAAGGTLRTGAVNTSGINGGDGGDIDITAGSTLRTGNITANGSGLLSGDGGHITLQSGTSLQAGSISSNGSGLAGDGGDINLTAGTTIKASTINSIGSGFGHGGEIVLSSGSGLTTGALNASGGILGNPGDISITAGTNGNGNVTVSDITDNGLFGGGSVTITTPGTINVSGSITAINGTVTLNSSNNNIGDIEVGKGNIQINPIGSSDVPIVIDLSDVTKYGEANVVVGGAEGFKNDIVIKNDCNQCFSNLTSVTINTQGDYTATGTTLTLDPNQSFQVNAGGNISTGTVNGGKSVSFVGSGTITVDGAINMPGGTVQLSGSSFDISAPINAGGGTVSIQPIESTSIDGSQLGNISAANLNIGNGQPAQSVSLEGATNLTGIQGAVNVNLGGDFDSSLASIQLGDNTSYVVNAGNIYSGSITGGAAIVMNSQQELAVTGDIFTTRGPIVLNGDLSNSGAPVTFASGINITGLSISVTSIGGDLTSGANLTSLNTELAMYSGGALNILDNSNLTARTDVSLRAMGNIELGSSGGAGVAISAGGLASGIDPFGRSGTFSSSDVTSAGNVTINGYMDGSGAGDLNVGRNTTIVAAGNGSSGGNLTLLSGGDLHVEDNTRIGAFGGDLSLGAWGSIEIDGSTLVSAATDNQSAGGTYVGGRMAVIAGLPDTNVGQLLGNLASTRTSENRQTAGYDLSANTVTSTGGSVIELIFDDKDLKTLTSNNIVLNGGVLFLDPPPDPTIPHTVTISGTSINVFGPTITAAPGGVGNGNAGGVVVPPVVVIPGGTGGTTGGTTGGATVPGTTGGTVPGLNTGSSAIGGTAILGLPSSVVNPNDTTARSSSVSSQQQQSTLGISFSGNSTVASDTLDDDTTQPSLRQSLFCSRLQLLKPSDDVDDDSWIIASGSCEPFTFEEHDGSLIVGSGPAKLAPASDRTLLLKEGKILVVTVDRIHVVRTALCNITIPVNTATVVEVDPSTNLVRIADLAGGKTSVTICRNDETFILSAAPGEQLILGESGVVDSAFTQLNVPNVSYEKVAAWQIEMSGLRGQKLKFDRNQMALAEPLLNCSNRCVNQIQNRRIEQLLQSMKTDDTILKSMGNEGKGKQLIESELPDAVNKLRPIGFESGASIENPGFGLTSINAGGALVKYVGKCKMSLTSPGLLHLQEGEILVHAPKKTVIKAGASHIEVKAGSMATVTVRDGMVKVRNLFENKRTSITAAVAGKRHIGVQIGQELIIGPKGIPLSRALSDDPVGRRRLTSIDLATGHTCISSEVSLSSLLQNSPVLAHLIRSAENEDRALATRVMKAAVCVSIVTQGHGNYSMVNP